MINPAKSPPLLVPIGLILAGLTGLLLLQPLLLLKAPMIFGEFRFNAATLAAVHLFTLGFATTVMTGAFYQITPVMLIARPVSGPWVVPQAVLHLAGSALLIAGFYAYETLWIAVGGSLVTLGTALFIALVGRCMASSTQWTVSGSYMMAGLSFLAGTVLWGLTLALNLRWNFLGDTLSNAPLGGHLVLGLGGWFMLTIFGVSYQLIPMFALSSRTSDQQAKQALAYLTTGCWAAFLALATRQPAYLTGLLLLPALAGVGLYAGEMAAVLRRRRRPELDLGMRYALTSLAFLGLSLLLYAAGVATGVTRVLVAATWLFLPGFVGSMILGMLYKIVPFLIWHYLLKSRTDKSQRLPTLEQMYHRGIAKAGFLLWTGGQLLTTLVVLAAGTSLPALLRAALALGGTGALLFIFTILQVLRAKPLE
ncbi:MAG: hypothetical protein ACOY93_06105 [Bacillota bacterium]